MLIDLDSVTELDDSSIFTLNREPDRSYEKDYNAQFDLTIEMDFDIIQFKRQGYHIFDFISDIGGIQSILISVFASLVSIWNYKMLDNYLVSHLYKLERHDQGAG